MLILGKERKGETRLIRIRGIGVEQGTVHVFLQASV